MMKNPPGRWRFGDNSKFLAELTVLSTGEQHKWKLKQAESGSLARLELRRLREASQCSLAKRSLQCKAVWKRLRTCLGSDVERSPAEQEE